MTVPCSRSTRTCAALLLNYALMINSQNIGRIRSHGAISSGMEAKKEKEEVKVNGIDDYVVSLEHNNLLGHH